MNRKLPDPTSRVLLLNRANQAATRILDVLFSLCGLICTLPLTLPVAVLIFVDSGRPLFYRGSRVGINGTKFFIFKFRTMIISPIENESSITRWNDPRVTKIGKHLRWWKIDELPQLWNVIRGEMSLVGPRPETPDVVATYSDEMRLVLSVPPGLTSVASVVLHDEESLLRLMKDPEDANIQVLVPFKVKLALVHVFNRSLVLYLSLLVRTVVTLLRDRLGLARDTPQLAEVRRILLERNSYAASPPK